MTLHRFATEYVDNGNEYPIDEYEFVQDAHEFAFATDLLDEEVV